MSNVTDVGIESLRDIYVLANTPAFLYKKLLAHPSVHRMARTASIGELLTIYDKAAREKPLSQDPMTTAAVGYAALVAAIIKDYHKTRSFIEGLRAYDLEWGPAIAQLFLTRPVGVTYRVLQASPPPVSSGTSFSTPVSVTTERLEAKTDEHAHRD